MMASNMAPQTQTGQVKRTSFSGFPGGSASMFLDRSKAGIRGSTPDSEALASSDDEPDHLPRLRPVTSNPGPKPVRRASWLAETQQSANRKGSMGGNGPFLPASPGSAVASGEQMHWAGNSGSSAGTAIGRGHSTSTSFPWGNTIWNSDTQKGPPQRLTEVLPSPTTMVPPGSAGFYNEEPLRSPPLGQDNVSESAIPFAIPLQPTLKTYRSQSYSVGQMDPESSVVPPTNHNGYGAYGRQRNGTSFTVLQHRPSRPSMLGEGSHDPSHLGQLREVDDDGESSNGSEAGVQLSTQARTIEQLAMENAILRQAAAQQVERETRSRNRAVIGTATKVPRTTGQSYQQRMRDHVPEESEIALYEADDPDDPRSIRFEGFNGRRSSEYATTSNFQYTIPGIPENRNVESVKKGHWQSSLGFGGIGEAPQSRRHSFADVPTRQNSISSAGDSPNGPSADISVRANGRHGSPGGYEVSTRPSQGDGSEYTPFSSPLFHPTQRLEERSLELEHLRNREFAVAYFARDQSMRPADHGSSVSATNMHQLYMQSQYGRPHPQHLSLAQTRPNQLLYIVTFKAQRADVFYVQEGTGLQVRKGDLVIVEADRGADLGTVASEGIPFAEAKEQKDKYMQEHYTWLMVFSRHGQNGTVARPNPNGQPNTSTSAIGGMGGSPSQTGSQELPSGELKPKMIKRVAQPHEIQTLRDKEGNEAKAKRVCQQKVVEHRLNMEILEAEFQMDWKKLTFYYFAEEYINFNSLVTDLFKIYKTRIWMSAINPASFQTPVGGLQIPGGAASSALSGDVENHGGRRQQRQQPTSIPGSTQVATNFDQTWSPNQDGNVMNGMAYPQLYAQQFLPQGLDMRQLEQYPLEYHQGVQQMQSYISPGYNVNDLRHSSSFSSRPESSNGGPQPSHSLGRDWNQAMQGLSLGR